MEGSGLQGPVDAWIDSTGRGRVEPGPWLNQKKNLLREMKKFANEKTTPSK